jgi:hypothetical protein
MPEQDAAGGNGIGAPPRAPTRRTEHEANVISPPDEDRHLTRCPLAGPTVSQYYYTT